MKKILFYLFIIIVGCKTDECIHMGKSVKYQLDTNEFSKIPYKDYDTLVIKLTSTGWTLYFYADKWTTGYEPAILNPCKLTDIRQFRSLTFTTHTYSPVDGMQITIKHFIPSDSKGAGSVRVCIYNPSIFTVSNIGYPFQTDSMTIQGKTYYNINYFPNDQNGFKPGGCYYNKDFGILKIEHIDGENYELIKK